MAGKGYKWRKNFDFKRFFTNMESISGHHETTAVKVKKKNNKTIYIYK